MGASSDGMQDETAPPFGARFPKTPEQVESLRAAGLAAAADLCSFVDASPTPFHAALETTRRLAERGFAPLDEREAWTLAPNERRVVVRGATVIAFVVGTESPAGGAFRIIGAHTDSPNLRVKPNADVQKRGYRQIGVETYGGVLLSTWLDRDLSIAGRVVLDRGGGTVAERLVDLERPVARVASLAIHLNRGVNTDGLVLNQQKHMIPIVGLDAEDTLLTDVARALGESARDVLAFDLCLYDTARATIGGSDRELVFAARLDNLASCHAATSALAACVAPSKATRVVALYDHEECGSKSASGAAGSVLRDVLTRIVEAHPDRQPQAMARAMAASFLVSADMAHAIHPNYSDQHEAQHAPQIGRGLVIKSNANQSYATDGATAAQFKAWCRDVGYEAQRFVVRSDLPCGSTIGPITAAELGMRTVDVGAPMLSMHSCREMAGTVDAHLAIETFKRALA